ncbi:MULTISPECIES: capsid protein [Staphylococcus]|uniref:capsid protein n=1 Tax=Staphylococcus TaxID=1279 RepID=UPI0008A47101|nr:MULTISPECIES: capsid protein [Staphylococcus]MCG1791350.1 capsid protein [Staphylococcus epidermidis]MCG2157931.1 capsid protein [Staphylococcus epidermidis]MDS3959666.1 capsid protein [Staphylococcus epidermidis]NAM68150.1 capsid protein [Staphylococcus epidermidis]NAM82632.1 capsid protein [Staphylococcus epidermidis]
MTVEYNLTNTESLSQAKSIDFASKFGNNINKLLEILGVTNKLPMNVGSNIKIYKYSVEESDYHVAEGDEIPLTKVKRELVQTIELVFDKYRKATPAESIQAHGFDLAVNKTDYELLRHAQKKIRTDFSEVLKASAGTELDSGKRALKSKNLQGALAKGRAKLSTVIESDITPIAFVNPDDTAEHIANGLIVSNGSLFGMGLLTNYVGVKVIELAEVPQGDVWMTASENLNVAFANPNGELGRAFNFATDETGFVGVLHDIRSNRLTSETVLMTGLKIFPENIDAVVKVKIKADDQLPS